MSPITGDARVSKPYRVEWRPSLVTLWSLDGFADEHGDALARARSAVEVHGGQARVLSQHVIHIEGIGADA